MQKKPLNIVHKIYEIFVQTKILNVAQKYIKCGTETGNNEGKYIKHGAETFEI